IRIRDNDKPVQIVGVVKDSVYGLDSPIGAPARPVFYMSLRQNPQVHLELHVRTAGDPSLISSAVLKNIQNMNSEIVPTTITTLADVVSGKGLFMPRISAVLSSVFGAIALSLAIIGLYGVVSFMVERRTQEIALRMALGAQKPRILRMILFSSVVLVG